MVVGVTQTGRKRTKGVALLTLGSGVNVARWNDPATGKQRQTNLDKLGLKTAKARQDWAAAKQAELESEKTQRRTPWVQTLVEVHKMLGDWSKEYALRKNHKLRGMKVASVSEWAKTCEQACLDVFRRVQEVRPHTPAGRVENDLHLEVLYMVVHRGRIKSGQLKSLADRHPRVASHLAGDGESARRARHRMLQDLREAGLVIYEGGWWQLPGGDS